MITAEIVELTPKMAQKFLDNNASNRALSAFTAEKYAKSIRRGEWKLNGEPIIIFSNGRTGNGQHRCDAVVKTGISIFTLLVSGIDEGVFGTIDGGKTRSAADALGIDGELNTTKLASATRTHLAYGLTGRDEFCITTTQISNHLAAHPDVRYWVQRYASSKSINFMPASFCGYMAIVSERHGRHELDKFFDQLATGVNLSEGSPALVLRDRLVSQTKTNKLDKTVISAFIIKAINAFILGKKLTFLRYTNQEDFPVLV